MFESNKKQFFNNLYFLLPSIVYLLIYFPSISFGSAWSDDPLVIGEFTKDINLVIKSFVDVASFQGGVHYMPLFYLNSFLINSLFGENAYQFGFHISQYIFQALVFALATLFINKLIKNKLISVCVILLWVLNPVNLQTLTRLLITPAGVPATIFILCFLILYLQSLTINETSKKYLIVFFANICFFLSLLCGEKYFFYPCLLWLICLVLKQNKTKQNKTKQILIFTHIFCLYFVLSDSYFSNRWMPCRTSRQ